MVSYLDLIFNNIPIQSLALLSLLSLLLSVLIMWWPNFDFLLVDDSYQDYDMRNAAIVDTVIERLDAEGLHTIYTVWDHSQLRDENHPWSDGLWAQNGFSELSIVSNFNIKIFHVRYPSCLNLMYGQL